MRIDWFTIGAQALNFLILVWLMKRFLYKPILTAIDEREKLIEKEVGDARTQVADAAKERAEFESKNVEFDKQRSALLLQATDDVKVERQRLLNDARQAAADYTAKRQAALKSDAENLNRAILERTQTEVFAIARRALSDLATTSLEERLGEVFTRRLRDMDGAAKQMLGKSVTSSKEPAVVRSAFALPADQEAVIKNALNEAFSADVAVRFETAPQLISGIELNAGGQKVAWSISEYLLSVQKGVDELIKSRDLPEDKAVSKAGTNADQAKPSVTVPLTSSQEQNKSDDGAHAPDRQNGKVAEHIGGKVDAPQTEGGKGSDNGIEGKASAQNGSIQEQSSTTMPAAGAAQVQATTPKIGKS